MNSLKNLRFCIKLFGYWYGEFSSREEARKGMAAASGASKHLGVKLKTKMYQCIPAGADDLVFIVRVEVAPT